MAESDDVAEKSQERPEKDQSLRKRLPLGSQVLASELEPSIGPTEPAALLRARIGVVFKRGLRGGRERSEPSRAEWRERPECLPVLHGTVHGHVAELACDVARLCRIRSCLPEDLESAEEWYKFAIDVYTRRCEESCAREIEEEMRAVIGQMVKLGEGSVPIESGEGQVQESEGVKA